MEVASPDDEAERKDGSKEEDNKEEEKEEGNETPGGKETLGKGARKTASWTHKDGNMSDKEEGGEEAIGHCWQAMSEKM